MLHAPYLYSLMSQQIFFIYTTMYRNIQLRKIETVFTGFPTIVSDINIS